MVFYLLNMLLYGTLVKNLCTPKYDLETEDAGVFAGINSTEGVVRDDYFEEFSRTAIPHVLNNLFRPSKKVVGSEKKTSIYLGFDGVSASYRNKYIVLSASKKFKLNRTPDTLPRDIDRDAVVFEYVCKSDKDKPKEINSYISALHTCELHRRFLGLATYSVQGEVDDGVQCKFFPPNNRKNSAHKLSEACTVPELRNGFWLNDSGDEDKRYKGRLFIKKRVYICDPGYSAGGNQVYTATCEDGNLTFIPCTTPTKAALNLRWLRAIGVYFILYVIVAVLPLVIYGKYLKRKYSTPIVSQQVTQQPSTSNTMYYY